MKAKNWKLWDDVNKSYFYDLSNPNMNNLNPPILTFGTKKEAEQYKDDFLSAGNYPDRPHTVIQVIGGVKQMTPEDIRKIDFAKISDVQLQKIVKRITQEKNDQKRQDLLYAAIDCTYRLTYGENVEYWKAFDKNIGKLICNEEFKEDLRFMLKDITKLLDECEKKRKEPIAW